jgi:hypothetical protein
MKLTGKCKEDFEKWFLKDIDIDEDEFFNNDTVLLIFYEESESMKYGVYVDFFDSVGIYIDVTNIDSCNTLFACVINDKLPKFYFSSRQEARTQAIEKANEIYNKQEIIKNITKPNANIL